MRALTRFLRFAGGPAQRIAACPTLRRGQAQRYSASVLTPISCCCDCTVELVPIVTVVTRDSIFRSLTGLIVDDRLVNHLGETDVLEFHSRIRVLVA